MKNFSMILAVDNENGIGKNGDLAWKIPEDMKYFKDVTTQVKDTRKRNAVIMGRKTWESIPEKYKPLPNRLNCVLSSKYNKGTHDIMQDSLGFRDLELCYKHLLKREDIENIFIIGGSYLYNMVLDNRHLEYVHITRIYEKFHCDVFFDGLPSEFEQVSRSEMKNHEGLEYEFLVYKRNRGFIEKIKRWLK